MTGLPHSETILQQDDGTYAAIYGPFVLRTAFQPIFGQVAGKLKVKAFEALIRPTKRALVESPGTFFTAVVPDDRAMVDALCRRLHILNMGQLKRPETDIFLNFDPSVFNDDSVTAQEAERIAESALAAGLDPSNVVCEIVEKRESTNDALLAFAHNFRARGFKLAIDDYGTAGSDISRIDQLKPDIVKFDGSWVLRYMHSRDGVALLAGMIERFQRRGITTLFEGLQTPREVETAMELNIDLLQGYALARPELMPTQFNATFPSLAASAAGASPERSVTEPTEQPGGSLREFLPERTRQSSDGTSPFGRRGRDD